MVRSPDWSCSTNLICHDFKARALVLTMSNGWMLRRTSFQVGLRDKRGDQWLRINVCVTRTIRKTLSTNSQTRLAATGSLSTIDSGSKAEDDRHKTILILVCNRMAAMLGMFGGCPIWQSSRFKREHRAAPWLLINQTAGEDFHRAEP